MCTCTHTPRQMVGSPSSRTESDVVLQCEVLRRCPLKSNLLTVQLSTYPVPNSLPCRSAHHWSCCHLLSAFPSFQTLCQWLGLFSSHLLLLGLMSWFQGPIQQSLLTTWHQTFQQTQFSFPTVIGVHEEGWGQMDTAVNKGVSRSSTNVFLLTFTATQPWPLKASKVSWGKLPSLLLKLTHMHQWHPIRC